MDTVSSKSMEISCAELKRKNSINKKIARSLKMIYDY